MGYLTKKPVSIFMNSFYHDLGECPNFLIVMIQEDKVMLTKINSAESIGCSKFESGA